ncbi:MAG: SDR family NAD(P)-dependent oxidoreductase [Novosphingobium sp.]|nr:SDR family NAD(P)-dependent oxidoreductase [Novosphingobium sp.]
MKNAIFITGASSGIGKALSLRLAGNGVALGLLSRGRDASLEEVAALCREKGAEVFAYAADVSDAVATAAAAQAFLDRVGRIDVVVANAGVSAVDQDDEANWLDISKANMDVNFYGVINTIVPFIDTLKRQKHGSLAIISSISALRATHNSGPYSASKAAVNLWSEGLRLRLRPFKVSVTTLCVGFVDTAMTRSNKFWMPGLISADKAAALIDSKIRRKVRLTVLPWTSGGIWAIFHQMPGRLYDLVIDTAKKRQQ